MAKKTSKKMPANLVAHFKAKKGNTAPKSGKKGVRKTGKMPPGLAKYWANKNKGK